MATVARTSKNIVRLRANKCFVMNHGVNLGRLYSNPRYELPVGYAYFEDGSVYIQGMAAASQMSSDQLQAEMQLLEPLVRQPPPDMDRVRLEKPTHKRLMILGTNRADRFMERFSNQQSLNSLCTIFARNAADGERFSVETIPFKRIEIISGPTVASQPEGKVHPSPVVFQKRERRQFKTALISFQGTLIDGVLQPNVRLGNGLRVNTDAGLDTGLDAEAHKIARSISELTAKKRPQTTQSHAHGSQRHIEMRRAFENPQKPTEQTSWPRRTAQSHAQGSRRHVKGYVSRQHERPSFNAREAELNRREQQLFQLQQQLLMQSLPMSNRGLKTFSAKESKFSQSPEARPESDDRAAYIEAKERELQYREEVLRWKHQNFLLKQQLAEARTGSRSVNLDPVSTPVSPPESLYASQNAKEEFDTIPSYEDIMSSTSPTRIRLPRRKL
ncbi:hypothetical protein BU23DRAFT_72738 [Bimuria novae-zelandiae CBS 107.79]|uniref:Uncharacterized protein n=1 Tax=Bimuria novae-zelandiae CBS 107.79 TaxID=1447943 RepID=A0A6A5VDZ1_9PLEO|nr:hypothetical protein BU23DRAFT_72738 [Bimuria novae-zelandiae CBS 107.79]